MDAVEVRTRTGRSVAMMLPYPFPISSFPGEQGLKRLREAASRFQFPYVFVVALDRIRGWRIDDPSPFFDGATEQFLGSYTTGTGELSAAWVHTLASLAGAWMADLQWGWHSRGSSVPGEEELGSEFLHALRADELQPQA